MRVWAAIARFLVVGCAATRANDPASSTVRDHVQPLKSTQARMTRPRGDSPIPARLAVEEPPPGDSPVTKGTRPVTVALRLEMCDCKPATLTPSSKFAHDTPDVRTRNLGAPYRGTIQ